MPLQNKPNNPSEEDLTATAEGSSSPNTSTKHEYQGNQPFKAGSVERRAFTATIYAHAGKFGNSLLSFPITFLIIKALSEEDFGAYNIFLSVLFFSSILSNLGTLGVLQRYIPEFLEKRQNNNVRKTIKLASALRLAGGLLFVSVFLGFTDSIASWLNLPAVYTDYAFVVSLLILATIEVQTLGDGILGAMLDQKSVAAGRMISNLSLLIIVYLALNFDYGLKGIITARLIAFSGLLVFYAARVYRLSLRGKVSEDPPLPYRRMVRYGGFYLAGVFGTFFYDIAIDNFVIAHYWGASDVGKYTFAVFVATLAGFLFPMRLITPIVVNVAIRRYAATGRTDALCRMFSFFNKLVLFGILPAIVGIFVLSDEIVVLIFDQRYASTSSLVGLIVVFSLFRYLTFAFQILIKPLEILHLSLFQYGCSALNLVLDLWLIPRLGLQGAALATGFTVALNYAVLYVLVRRRVSIHTDWNGILRIFLNLAIMTGAVLLLRDWISGVISLFLVIGASGGLYFVSSYMNKVFTESERRLINGMVGRSICVF